MHHVKLDKNGVLCLPRQAMELLNIKAGDRIKLLLVGNELHVRKCNLVLYTENAYVMGDFEAQLHRPGAT